MTISPQILTAARRFLFLSLLLAWVNPQRAAVLPSTRLEESVSADAQERVAELTQKVLGPFRNEGALSDGGGTATNQIAPSITYTNIEAAFREASALMPGRLDLRFGIASALIGQALQTNAPFELRMKSALQTYQDIHALDTNGFQAALLYAAYTRAIGETNASENTIERLIRTHEARTRSYLEKFRRLDEVMQITPTNLPPKDLPASGRAIVIFGAALETNGLMKPKLIDRLKQGLAVAQLYPEAAIVVSGGNQKGGLTEAYLMSRWLVEQGISTNRVYPEDRATDTVGNAVYSCAILQKLGIAHVTLVTSASHMRRAMADLEEAAIDRGLRITFSHGAAPDQSALDEKRERVAVYRDVLRTSGLWAYPGIQR